MSRGESLPESVENLKTQASSTCNSRAWQSECSENPRGIGRGEKKNSSTAFIIIISTTRRVISLGIGEKCEGGRDRIRGEQRLGVVGERGGVTAHTIFRANMVEAMELMI
jgi:hypothetical protein